MNRQELVKAIAEQCGHSQATVNDVLNGLIATVQDTVAAGEKVNLVGFGSFEAVNRAERSGRNPLTGEAITIPASVAPRFTAGKAFKDRVNQ